MRENPLRLVDDKQVRIFKEDRTLRERGVCHCEKDLFNRAHHKTLAGPSNSADGRVRRTL